MAAAARPPGIGDARVPCPLCGGLIHPVAGRCKHCKEDLSTLRAGRPQAAAVLPALNGRPTPVPVAPGNGTSVHAAPAPTAVPLAIPARDGSAPILPQRVTGRDMEAARPRRRLLENWPLIVIVLAVIAIVTAVVIMVMPASAASRGGKKGLLAPPAPDRMETSPLPEKSSQIDPWQNGPSVPNAPDVTPPDPQPVPQPRATPDPPRQPDPNDDPDDLFGNLGGGSAFDQMLQGMNGTFAISMLGAACKKLQSCPGTGGGTVAMMCSSLSNFPRPALPASCPAAQRCLDAIDKMDCNSGLATGTDPFAAMMLVQDCATAATQC